MAITVFGEGGADTSFPFLLLINHPDILPAAIIEWHLVRIHTFRIAAFIKFVVFYSTKIDH